MKSRYRELVSQGNDALWQLRKSLNSRSPNNRKSAMQALQEIGTPEATKILEEYVRQEAKEFELAVLGMVWKSPKMRHYREDV